MNPQNNNSENPTKDQRISFIVENLIKKKIKVTANNIVLNSLFSIGGTISAEDANEYMNQLKVIKE